MSNGRTLVPDTKEVVNEETVFRKVNRRLLPFLLLCYTFAYLDRVNIGFAKLHMQADMPFLTDAIFGIAAGIFFLAYALLEIPSNMLMHRIGARKTITRIMVLWGLTSAAMLFVRGETSFYTLRFLLGIFEAGFAPGIILYLTYWYPAKRMGRVMGIYMLAGPIGSVAGSALSAWIIDITNHWGLLAGWQWMFLLQGAPAAILGYFFWKLMSDRPRDANWLSSRETEILEASINETKASHSAHRFVDALREPAVYIMSIAYFGIMCGIYAVSFWLPTILQDNGIESELTTGLLTSVPYVLTIPVMILLSRSSDVKHERKWHTATPAFLSAAGLAIGAYTSTNFFVSFVSLTIAVCAVWGAYTVFWAVPSEKFGGTAAAGGIAFINTIGIMGGAVAPTIMGFVRELTGSTQGGLLAMVALLVISIIALFMLPKFTKKKVE